MIAEPLPEMDAEIWQAGHPGRRVGLRRHAAGAGRRRRSGRSRRGATARRARSPTGRSRRRGCWSRRRARSSRPATPTQAARVYDEALSHDANAPDGVARARAAGRGARRIRRRARAVGAHGHRGGEPPTSAASTARCRRNGRWPAAASCRRSRGRRFPRGRRARSRRPRRRCGRARQAISAAALAEAGRGMGGALGAALLEHAGRCREVARDRRRRRRRAGRGREAGSVRADVDGRRACVTPRAPTIGPRWRCSTRSSSGPEGVLSMALARWSAALASRSGDKKRAAVLREGLAPVTMAAARDRIDQEAAAGAPLDAASLERLRAGITGAAGVAVLSWIEAGNLARRGEIAGALALMGRAIAENPDAIPLGLLAQQIAADSTDAGVRATAFDLWLRSDPRPPGGGRARAGGGPARRRPAARIRWRRAARSRPPSRRRRARRCSGRSRRRTRARGGRPTRRRRSLTAPTCGGRARSRPGCAPARCRTCRSAIRGSAFEDLRARLAESPAPPPTRSFELEARARLAERAGDPGALVSMLAAAAGAADPDRAASLAPRRADLVDAAVDRQGRARILGEALEGVPDDPSALALLLLEEASRRPPPGEALWRAGAAAAGRVRRADRALVPARGGRQRGAGRGRRRRGRPRVGAGCGDAVGSARAARAAALRRARGARPARTDDRRPHRRRVRAAPSTRPRPGWRWRWRRRWRRWTIRARRRRFARSRAADSPPTRGGRSPISTRGRVARETGRGFPPGLLAGPADETAAAARTALTDLFDAARGGNWDDAIASLRDGPHTRAPPGRRRCTRPRCWRKGAGKQADAGVLEAAALAAAGGDPDAVAVSGLAHIADGDGKAELRVAALELAATRFALDQAKVAVADGRVAAGASGRRGRRRRSRPRIAGARRSRWTRAACRRRARSGGTPPGAAISRWRSMRPRRRPPACTCRSTGSTPCCWRPRWPKMRRAASRAACLIAGARWRCCASVLEIDPGHEGAFEQLRTLLAETRGCDGAGGGAGGRASRWRRIRSR